MCIQILPSHNWHQNSHNIWCENILHEGSAIDKETTVTEVEVKSITDEASGYEDGGGFSGSTLVKLIPKYG